MSQYPYRGRYRILRLRDDGLWRDLGFALEIVGNTDRAIFDSHQLAIRGWLSGEGKDNVGGQFVAIPESHWKVMRANRSVNVEFEEAA